MSDDPQDRVTPGGPEHPGADDVFLLVQGRLEQVTREKLESHATSCPACRARLVTVRWIHDQVKEWGRVLFQDHLPTEEMVRHAEGGRGLSEHRVRNIERHLSLCDACEADSRLLASVGESLAEAKPSTSRAGVSGGFWGRLAGHGWRAPIWAYVAMVVLAFPAALGIRDLVNRPGTVQLSSGSPETVHVLPPPVVLAPGRERGAGSARVAAPFPGEGPLVLACEVPILSDGVTRYSGRLEDASGDVIWETPEMASVDAFGTFLIVIPSGVLDPGVFRLFIDERADSRATQRFEFGFELTE